MPVYQEQLSKRVHHLLRSIQGETVPRQDDQYGQAKSANRGRKSHRMAGFPFKGRNWCQRHQNVSLTTYQPLILETTVVSILTTVVSILTTVVCGRLKINNCCWTRDRSGTFKAMLQCSVVYQHMQIPSSFLVVRWQVTQSHSSMESNVNRLAKRVLFTGALTKPLHVFTDLCLYRQCVTIFWRELWEIQRYIKGKPRNSRQYVN